MAMIQDNVNNVFIYRGLHIKYTRILIYHMVLINIKHLRKRAAKAKVTFYMYTTYKNRY